MTFLRHGSLAVILCLFGTPASGATIVSTFPAHATCCGEGIGIGEPLLRFQHAVRFVSPGDYLLDLITFDLVSSFGTGLIVAQIYSEVGGLPGTILFSATAAGPAPSAGGHFSIAAGGTFLLEEGVAYWLTGVNTDPASQSYWWYSDQDAWRAVHDIPGRPSGGWPNWGNAFGGSGFPAGPGTPQSTVLSYQLDGTQIPEPSTLGLGLTGLTLIGLGGWRVRRGL